MYQRHLIRLGYAALIASEFVLCAPAPAQTPLKKLRLGIAATSVGFLPIYAAHQKGFYKDEGIDLEIILMSLAAANNAFFKGEIEYSAGLTGLALAVARNYPAKILIFTVAKPLQSFVSRKDIKEPRDLKGKKVGVGRFGGEEFVVLLPDTPLAIELRGAVPMAPCVLVAGTSVALAPFKGGTLVPQPDVVLPDLVTDAEGSLQVNAIWPADVPSGIALVLQAWIADSGAPQGASASEALMATVP